MSRTRRAWGCASAAMLLLLTGCATPSPHIPPDAAPRGGTAVYVTTQHPVTVLDDGTGPELCLGGVAASLPPQCGGPALIGWDWSAWVGGYEEVGGVRWGEFIVAGAYDEGTDEFTATDVQTAAGYEWPAQDDVDLSTPCATPAGGWRVRDASLTTAESMEAVFSRAERLDGYATAWMDQSPNPASHSDATDEQREAAMNDPALTIVNVAVTGDAGEAEAMLREIWGGMLCVSRATRTASDLDAIANEIFSAQLPGVLGGGRTGRAETIEVLVVYDDGTLQSRFDEEYGVGLVRVDSALVPAS